MLKLTPLLLAALQEILEEVRKELQKVKEEIIGGKFGRAAENAQFALSAFVLWF